MQITKMLPLSFLLLACISNVVFGQRSDKKFYYSLAQSFDVAGQTSSLLPFGLSVGYSSQIASSPFHLGISTSYQNYGKSSFQDTTTSHNLYRYSLDLFFDVFAKGNFRFFVKGSWGVNRMDTRSFTGVNEAGHLFGSILSLLIASDDEEEYHEEEEIELEPLVVLKRDERYSFGYGLGVGLEWSFGRRSSLFIEAGFWELGDTRFVEEDKTWVATDQISYEYTQAHLTLLDLRIGIIHTL